MLIFHIRKEKMDWCYVINKILVYHLSSSFTELAGLSVSDKIEI